jgi:CBS domain-containing protein
MSIGRICVREVDTARPDESVAVVAERMHQRAVGMLVVVNTGNRIVGIVTDRDLVSRVLAKGRCPTETPICEVMTASPTTISEWAQIEPALKIMREGKFRRIPVVDQDSKLVGLITLDDILMLLCEEFSQIGQLLKRETPRAVVDEQECSLTAVATQSGDALLSVGD